MSTSSNTSFLLAKIVVPPTTSSHRNKATGAAILT